MKSSALLFLGIAAALAAVAVMAATGANLSATEKFSQTYPISATGEVTLENINGSIEVVAWDEKEILLEAEKRAHRSEDLQLIVIHVSASPKRLTISTEHRRSDWLRFRSSGEVKYTLKVPSGISLAKLHSVNGSISVRGMQGTVRANTVNGGIEVEGLADTASLESVNGSVTARVTRLEARKSLKAATVNGSCTVTLPANIAANVRAATVNGRVSSVLPITEGEATRKKLHGRIGTEPSATIVVETVNGDITLGCD